jgi:membrane-associated protein
MHEITGWLDGLGGASAYAAVAVLVCCEVAVPFGFLLPGETSAVLGGVLAHEQRASVIGMAVAAVAAALAGDSIGYLMGRLTGARLRANDRTDRRADRLREAGRLMDRHGAAAVFFGRFLPFVRSAVPPLAGATGMPYRRFLSADVPAALIWGTGSVLAGWAAGAAWTRYQHTLAGAALGLLGVAAVAAVLVQARRRGRRRG